MPNPSHSSETLCDCAPPCNPCNPDPQASALYQAGYQQALTNFAVTDDLLHHLSTDSEAPWAALTRTEIEALAAILIQTLATQLDSNLLALYLDVIRHAPLATFTPVTKLRFLLPATDLPITFPNVEMPGFLYGDRLRWTAQEDTTDWGTVIGQFYSFAPHHCRWRWCYLIWLDPNSPSAAWVKADIAWEDDLERLDLEPAR